MSTVILVNNIYLPLGAPETQAFEQALRRLKLPSGRAEGVYPVKVSLDARRRKAVRFVYTVGVSVPGSERELVRRLDDPSVSLREEAEFRLSPGEEPLRCRPVVAGFGPAGMFCALVLARYGYRPIVVERGAAVEERVEAVERFWRTGVLDPRTNVQFGEGGAGTFSDGKLTTRIHDPLCSFILQELHRHGAPEEILYRAKPHIGTDRLRQVVRSIREEILSLGGEIRFETALEALDCRGGQLRSVVAGGQELETRTLVLAVGHSARDTFEMLLGQGVALQSKPFSVGVRIEHLQSRINRALYGELAGHPALPQGEYQLSWRENGRGVYTFCMCPGGVVVPAASEPSAVVTNGMSEYARDRENANAALVVSVDAADFGGGPMAGMQFQRRLEQLAFRLGGDGYGAPAQTVGCFLDGRAGLELGKVRPSYALGVRPANLAGLFPSGICRMLRLGLEAFDHRLHGFAAPDAVLTGVETRTSSPVRILRGETLEADGLAGLYPCGEGAGYAGGIVSAAVDGVRVASALVKRYRPGV